MDGTVKKLQANLVEGLIKNKVIHSPDVEQAFRTVPRHLFLPGEPLERVYSDQAIAVKRDEEGNWTSSSSQPAIMAIMLEQLDLRPGMRVLEIGAGSGYNAALIASIVGPRGQVVTVDLQPDMVEAAREHLHAAGFDHIQAIHGDGGAGYAPGSPYDRIIITASSSMITPAWREQLTGNGVLVLPLDIGAGLQKCVAFQRQGDVLLSRSVVDAGFMPLRGNYAAALPRRIQLGSDPRLYISSFQDFAVDGETLNAWFHQPREDRSTGLKVSLKEILVSFTAWLTVQGIGWMQLNALEELAEQEIFPAVLRLKGEKASSSTLALAGSDGLAAIRRPPGQDVPFTEPHRMGEEFSNPFDLYIRSYGPGEDAIHHILNLLHRWEREGRPPADRLRFRAVPEGQQHALREGEYLLRRPWTDIIAWYD